MKNLSPVCCKWAREDKGMSRGITENDAKEYLEDMLTEGQVIGDEIVARDDEEFIKVAIAALEEIQRYRAIGTVEEIEGLNFSSNQLRLAKLVEEYKEKLKEYEAIGTVMECQEAGERQKAKKPLLHKDTNRADCPVCGGTVRGIDKPFGNWCSHCGQEIDWSE